MKNIDTKISYGPILNGAQKFGSLENKAIVIKKRLVER